MSTLKGVVCGLVVGGLSLSVAAQPPAPPAPPAPGGPVDRLPGKGPGGPGAGLSAEKAKAAWEMEAKTVAGNLSLSDDQTKALVKAYADARTSNDAEFSKMREKMRDGGGGGDMRQALEDLTKSERSKFEKALKDAKLSDEHVTKAMASLGTFNRQWDTWVDTVAGFKLEAAKQTDAFKAIEEYVVALGKVRGQGAGGDREAMRTAMQDARKKLTDKMKTLVSEEQLKQFEATLGAGRGGAGGGGKGKGGEPKGTN